MTTRRVLIIEPDADARHALVELVASAGHQVQSAADEERAGHMLSNASVDLLVCKSERRNGPGTDFVVHVRAGEFVGQPRIVVLTADPDPEVRVALLECGADDVLVAPCHPRELLARIAACLSRTPAVPTRAVLRGGRLELDPSSWCVRADGRLVDLTSSEFRLLHYLMRHSGAILSRRALLENVWDTGTDISPRTVDVHIRRLRAALESHGCDCYVQTIRSVGYRFSTHVESSPPGKVRGARRRADHRLPGHHAP